MFLDRLQRLCQQTMCHSDNAVAQAVINQEAEHRLLAAFINELVGTAGRHVQLQMLKTIDKALNMAIIATNADKEEKASVRDDQGSNIRVFTVGGDHGETQDKRYDRPRGKIQWSRGRGAGSQHRAGPTQYPGVSRTHSYRTDSRNSVQPENQVRATGGGAASGPRNSNDRYCASRPRGVNLGGIQCYSCGLFGHICSTCP
jgi:hypothetical protein